MTSSRSTCVRFFGWGATDLEMLFTSLWTCVKIWFRFSTLSFFTALICEDKRYSRAAAATVSLNFEKRTCFSVVVTGFALFLCFRRLFATWKTVLVFFPFCLFFPISPEENNKKHWNVNYVTSKDFTLLDLVPGPASSFWQASSLNTLKHTQLCNNAYILSVWVFLY